MTAERATSRLGEDNGEPLEIGPLRVEEVPAVARLHASFFRGPDHGHSIANLGDAFLERIFYGLNVENPLFFCDVARHGDRVVGFSVYTTDRQRLFRYTIRRKFFPLVARLSWLVLSNPRRLVALASNLRYVGGEKLPSTTTVAGWWLLLGVLPEYRGRDFVERTGVTLASSMARLMEDTMQSRGCRAWYAAPHPWNKAINRFLADCGGELVGADHAQGLDVVYFVKEFEVT